MMRPVILLFLIVSDIISVVLSFCHSHVIVSQKWNAVSRTASIRHHPHNVDNPPTPSTPSSLRQQAQEHTNDSIISLLESSGYDSRIVQVSNCDPEPRIVEVFVNGETVLGRLVEILDSNNSHNNNPPSPRAAVDLLFRPNSKEENAQQRIVVDLGQITTFWSTEESRAWNKDESNVINYEKSLELVEKYKSNPVALDKLLDKVYARFVRQGRNTFPQKRVPKSKMNDSLALIFKKLQKTGPAYSRLLDSGILAEYLSSSITGTTNDLVLQRSVASLLLSQDAKEGGRFKRWPSLVVSHDPDHSNPQEWIILNGGWLVVDQNVRAGTEARKLMERSVLTDSQTKNSPKPSYATTVQRTVSDERILQRLECLAMGEIFHDQEQRQDTIKLEKDVRETLRTLDLPFSSVGGTKALVRMGRWTASTRAEMKQVVQPWSPQILEAATWYAQSNRQQQQFADETRTDLRKFPSICVDARSTAFRDDAMSIRPRASTGRWLDEDASKWEILVHITDMSDVYVPQLAMIPDPNGFLPILQKAAESRGTSRYDLPLGPLHLLPPTVLQSFSFSADSNCHPCVTLWAYIDERNGRLLDAGFERSMVAPPSLVSYEEASELMDSSSSSSSSSSSGAADLSKDLVRLRSVLLVIERNLNIWKQRRIRDSDKAQKREGRLASRASDFDKVDEGEAEDVTIGFQRTRGHRLVDNCLDLYSFAGRKFLQKARAPVPFARGADVSKGGRLATAPLRRYIDGQGQRQLLAVLCNHGKPMTLEECKLAGRMANNARNAISTVKAGRVNKNVSSS